MKCLSTSSISAIAYRSEWSFFVAVSSNGYFWNSYILCAFGESYIKMVISEVVQIFFCFFLILHEKSKLTFKFIKFCPNFFGPSSTSVAVHISRICMFLLNLSFIIFLILVRVFYIFLIIFRSQFSLVLLFYI